MGCSTKHNVWSFSQIFFSIIMMRFIYVAVHINSSFHFIDDQYSVVPCHGFVKLTFLSRAQDAGQWFAIQQQTTGEVETQKCITHSAGRGTQTHLKGLHGAGQGMVQTE